MKEYKVKDLLLQLSKVYGVLATALSMIPDAHATQDLAERVRDRDKREAENYQEPVRNYTVWRISMYVGFVCGLPLGGLFALWLLVNVFKG